MKLTIQQRLNLEGMIRQQRSPDDETLMLNFDLLQKVRVPESERPLYMRDNPAGGVEFVTRAIQTAGVLEVELNSAELRRLESLLREWENYGTDDVEWLMAIKKQITAINSGVAATKPDGAAKEHGKRERASAN
jgi:hypothetical protein